MPSRTGGQLVEYAVYVSHDTVAAGHVEIVASNYGMDDHALAIRDSRGTVLASTPVLHPQGSSPLDVNLAPGTYTLFCPLLNHEQLGMHMQLVVQAR